MAPAPSASRNHDTPQQAGPWQVERDAFARAAGGAIVFGVPLLYTMEMWWIGTILPPSHVLALLTITFAANIGLARMSGYRPDRGSLRMDIEEAAGALAVGALLAIIMLAVLGRISLDSSLTTATGMVAIQMIPLSIGASVAGVVFSSGRAPDDDDENETDDEQPAAPDTPDNRRRERRRALLNDIGATVAGAFFIGVSIAPTDEIPMLAVGLSTWNVVALFLLTLLIGYIVVFASGFDPEHRDGGDGGAFQHPITETALATIIALVVAAGMLTAFGHIDETTSLHTALLYTLVLGVPAAVGGAAGRVVI